MARSLSDIAVRDEAKEVWPDARPQAWNNRRRIRWNTLRIFSGRERRRCSQIVRRSRTINIGQAPRHNKPENQLRCGSIKAAIWENVSEKCQFFATSFSRPFKDQSGAWRNGTSFGLNDLKALVSVAREAKEWISAHVLKRCAASLGSLRHSGASFPRSL